MLKVNEMIDGLAPLDLCDPEDQDTFYVRWNQFSNSQYRDAFGNRRYCLATLIRYASNGAQMLEFAADDRIGEELLFEAYWTFMRSLLTPDAWSFRPLGEVLGLHALKLDGRLPISEEGAPFQGLVQQPLNAAVGYGVLQIVLFADLQDAVLGK